MPEIIVALNETPKKKTSGSGGMSSDVWKLVIEEKTPTLKFHKVLNKIINLMYESGDIPLRITTNKILPVP
ncbi:hypothetical protein AYI68_g3586 [Smittium mucronatum]|uniref:Uncharacterized protein n=1 Tax=Smittium mucronatum TaxID=133383 RepID=A0A1R0GZJ7_9FUNG|nr:hypothetical protein AYI68_g3586 [Smittium mucronatum]